MEVGRAAAPPRQTTLSHHSHTQQQPPNNKQNTQKQTDDGKKNKKRSRVLETIRRARGEGVRHVMNLGHGVLPGTPEENVAHYFEVARTAHERGI